MKTATGILRDEHNAILKMLDVAEEAARRIRQNKQVAPEILSGLLEFFRIFADRCHHGKEEDCLFPLLEKKGLPRDGGPVGVMLHEHDEGRKLIGMMAEAAEAIAGGETDSDLKWADAAIGYALLLRDHIAKENDILFAMAEQLLSESEQAQLVAAFEDVELNKLGAGTHERLHALMDRLYVEIFGNQK
jgi:hemerythrin-like domain-containing protein